MADSASAQMRSSAAGKPEGIAVVQETAESYELLVVYDGPPNGSPRLLRFSKR